MILVDSTVYIDMLRAGLHPAVELRRWIESDQLLGCGIIRVEVLRGIIQPKVHEDMKSLFGILPTAGLEAELWEAAAELAWELDRQGRVLPLTDIAIASCALRYDATVVSTDEHFRRIPKLKVHSNLSRL